MAIASAPRLRNPPIVEAVFDVDCDLPPGFDLAALEGAARARFEDHYPNVQTQLLQHHHIEMKPDSPPSMASPPAVQAFQFRHEDERQLVQVRAQGFCFNQ